MKITKTMNCFFFHFLCPLIGVQTERKIELIRCVNEIDILRANDAKIHIENE